MKHCASRVIVASWALLFLAVFPTTIGKVYSQAGPSAKYIILMVADGWGEKQIEATNKYTGNTPSYQQSGAGWSKHWISTFPSGGSYNSTQAWSNFTYVLQNPTDSAAAATALYTGLKTQNARITASPDGASRFVSIGEKAKTVGKSVGAVSSVPLSHATPGAWTSHNRDRSNGYAIADEALFGNPNTTGQPSDPFYAGGLGPTLPSVDVLIGDRRTNYVNDTIRNTLVSDGVYEVVEGVAGQDGGANLLAAANDSNVTKLAGLFDHVFHNADGSGFDSETPTLADSTEAALAVLSRDPNGFVLMVEGGAVDWAGHSNNMNQMIGEMKDFNEAVQAVIDWVNDPTNDATWDNTLVIVTGDHETGYLTQAPGVFPDQSLGQVNAATVALEKSYTGSNGRRASWVDTDNDGVIDAGETVHWAWNSSGHSNSLIPLYARGAGAELFPGHATSNDPVRGAYLDNTDVFSVMDTVAGGGGGGPGQPTVAFNVSTSSGSEASTPASLAVSLSGSSSSTVTVNYAVTGGTATNGTDYTIAAGPLTFDPGQTTRSINLTIIDDTLAEGIETVQVSLSNPTNATLGANVVHTYTINDNDSGGDGGLVVAYGFEEGSGTTTQDSSGNNNDGTLINGPVWVAGQNVGFGLSFDGSNDYVETGNTANLATWTISGWVRSPAAPSSAAASGPINRNSNYQINWNHPSATFRGAAAVQVGGTYYAASFGPLLANTWYYLAATYDGETLRAYKNGALITSNTAPSGVPNDETDSLKLGRHSSAAQFFQGTVDEVRIYNRALSLAEIQEDMATPVAPVTGPTGPVISNLNPASGPVGTSVVITGSNFGATQQTSTVTFNGTAASPTNWSGTSITVPVPTGATSGNVVVTVGGVASNGVNFTVTTSTAPVISNLNPASGPVGTSVVITGSNFGASQGTSTVTFNGTAASPTNWSGTSITVPVPTGATSGNVVVTVGGVASNGVAFTVEGDLVLAYGFEEGSGTTTQDSSGNDNDGTLINGPVWVAGQNVGFGLSFDGSNDYVETGNTANLATWTISGWVRSPAAPSSAAASGPINRNSNYQINWNHPSATFRGAAAVQVGGTYYAASFGPLLANTWYYLAATYDGETLRAYKNGALITSNTAPSGVPNDETDSLKLGRHSSAAQFFQGTVDEVRIYNRALSLAEIQEDMATPVAPVTGPTGPVISNLNPASGPVGTSVVITGSNFGATQQTSTVTFNGTAASPTNWSGTSITVPVPTGATSGNVVVTVGGVASNGVNFTVTTSTAPVISNLNPASGPVGTSVVITGSNFGASQGTSTVTFNGTAASPTNWSGTSITVPVPTGATSGNVVVTVGGVASNGVAFTVEGDLVLAYGFEEGSGTTTQDSSGNNNDGTLINGPVWVAGQNVGFGLSFDGSNDYVETGNTANLATWTISGWVRSPAAPSSAAASGPINRNSNYQINWNHPSATFRGAAAVQVGGTYYAASFGPLLANTWYYLAATYDGETLRAYKNGALITSNTAPSGVPNDETDSLKLGRHSSAAQFFQGTVDEVRIYNRALSLAEIQEDMATPVAP